MTYQTLLSSLVSLDVSHRPVQIIHSHFPKTPKARKAYLDGAQALGMGGFVVNMDCVPQRIEGEDEETYLARRFDAYLGENTPETEAVWDALCAFIDDCFERGMQIWIYDELAYPSGSAGHHVLKDHPEDGVMGLACLRVPFSGKGQIKGEDGKVLSAAAYPEENGVLITEKALPVCAHDGVIDVDLPEGTWQVCAVYAKKVAFLTENRLPYPDLLRADVVDRFIASTHEVYLHRLGPERISKVTAFFSDEPGLPTHGCSSYFYESNAIEAYTPDIANEIPDLPSRALDLFHETDRDCAAFRRRYRTAVADRFAKNYFYRIGAWCESHGTAMTGHLYGEETLSMQIGLNADLFGLYRYMTMPGVDRLYCTDPRDVIAEKTATSAAHFYGRKKTMSENSFHLEHNFWHTPETATPESRLNSTYYQMQLGLTNISSYFGYPDLSRVTSDAPSPDPSFSAWQERTARASTFVSAGKHVAPLLVLIPMKAAYERFMSPDHKYWNPGPCIVAPYQPEPIKRLEFDYGTLLEQLQDARCDFDLVDDIALSQCRFENGKIFAPHETFDALVLFADGQPEDKTANAILTHLKAGGSVFAVQSDREHPFFTTLAQTYPDSFLLYSQSDLLRVILSRIPPVLALDAPGTVRVRKSEIADATLYFLHNRGEKTKITLREQGDFTAVSIEGGSETSFVSDGNTPLTLERFSPLLLIKRNE